MVTVVNHLRLSGPLPDTAYEALEAAFPEMQALGCRACQLVQAADDHLILVLVFTGCFPRTLVDTIKDGVGHVLQKVEKERAALPEPAAPPGGPR